MRIHHLNCGTFCPLGGRFMDGFSKGPLGKLVCHCLLVETDDHGLVLIDTGLGLRDVERPTRRLSPLYMALLNTRLRREETAVAQIEALGFSPRDVRHVVLTHLDFDHAGGLEDFPEAAIHVMSDERRAADERRGFVARRRYRPAQWDEVRDWRLYKSGGEPWFGFEAVRHLEGLPPEILLVPLVGHTRGHAGVAVETDRGWLLQAGDAYFHHAEIGGPRRLCPLGLRAYQTLMEVDRDKRLWNQDRLRKLARDRQSDVRIFCAHDAVEFGQLKRRASAEELAAARAVQSDLVDPDVKAVSPGWPEGPSASP